MSNREYVWTPEGIGRARRAGVDLAEVTDALHAPVGLRVERQLGDLLLLVMGMAGTGRVIAVWCDRIAGTLTYKIFSVGLLGPKDLDEWRRHL